MGETPLGTGRVSRVVYIALACSALWMVSQTASLKADEEPTPPVPSAAWLIVAVAGAVQPPELGPLAAALGLPDTRTAVSTAVENVVGSAAAERERRQRAAAQALRQADAGVAASAGPAEACFNQMRTVICPIVGGIPFMREIVGGFAMLGGFSCPMGPSAAGGRPGA